MRSITIEDLSYLTTREMWVLLSELGFPYCDFDVTEKEDLTTHEMVKVPKFTPRSDYENMKSDIWAGIGLLNREQKRKYLKRIEKLVRPRMKQQEVIDNG